jgi:hypothetical protein
MKNAALAISAVLLSLAVPSAATGAGLKGRIKGGVKFYLDVRFVQPTGEGSFATSGAFTDSGTFVSFSAGTTADGRVKIWRNFTGRKGSIVVQDVFSKTETGSWTILSGTGAYRSLRGRGTSVGENVDHTLGEILPPVRVIAVAAGNVFTATR